MARVSVSVLVPYRPDRGHRSRAWAWVKSRWRAEYPGWEIVVGRDPGPGPWCKARAVAAAADRALGDVFVIADADVWAEQMLPAVHQVVYQRSPWAVPHRFVKRLTAAATARALQTGVLRGELDRPMYQGVPGGGITVLPRGLYEQVPLDARFTGWGQEDLSWSMALETLAGPCWRGRTDLWHLWHPPQERLTSMWGSTESRALHERYAAARHDQEAMRALVAEITEEAHAQVRQA